MGLQGSRLLRPEYREAFERDLQRLHELSGPWNLVLISGDLTQTGTIREFALLNSSLLNSLGGYLARLGSTPRLLVVPGKHDVNERFAATERTIAGRWRESFRRSTPAGVHMRTAFEPFVRWASQWRIWNTGSTAQTVRPGLLPGDFSMTLMTDGLRVGIIGLNSTFFAFTSALNLYEIHVEQFEAATGEPVHDWVLRHDVVLLLTHASPSMLQAESLVQVYDRLMEPGRPVLHLCGNRTHDVWLSAPGTTEDPSCPSGALPLWRRRHRRPEVGVLRRATPRLQPRPDTPALPSRRIQDLRASQRWPRRAGARPRRRQDRGEVLRARRMGRPRNHRSRNPGLPPRLLPPSWGLPRQPPPGPRCDEIQFWIEKTRHS